MHSKDKKHSDKSNQPCQFEENCVKNCEILRRNCSKINLLKVFVRMSSHELLSGNPSEVGMYKFEYNSFCFVLFCLFTIFYTYFTNFVFRIELLLSGMCIKREINDVETGKYFYICVCIIK